MKNIIPSSTWEQLSLVVKNIIARVQVEKIYVLSVLCKTESPQHIFFAAMPETSLIVSFNLLVLTGETEKRSNDELQDIIEHRCDLPVAVTAYVLPVQQFNDWLMNDHPFAVKVYHKAELYYDAGLVPLAIPNDYNEPANQSLLQEDLDRNARQAMEFLCGAELFIVRKQYGLAAFHLHQAAEQLYSGIIRLITGLRVHTHNLDKLYRYSRHLLTNLDHVFPRDTETEEKLFHWLQKAYMDGRYSSDYGIRYPVVIQLSERVKKLLEISNGIRYPLPIGS